MAITFSIVTRGAHHAASVIERIGARGAAPRPALEEIYLTVLDIVDETFDKEGARGFEKWADDTYQWAYEKGRHGGDPRILRDTGLLHESMTTFRHPLQYVRIEKSKIVMSSRLLRGKVAQTGTRDGNTPARPMIRFTEGDRQAFAREILRYVMGRAV